MTVRRVFDNLKYIGLSIDVKPVLHMEEDESIITGAEFYETDTHDTYVWDGNDWYQKAVTSPRYAFRMEDTDVALTKITYIGEAPPGSDPGNPVWRIKRIDTSTGIEILWAEGTVNFDKIWTNSTTYTYA